MPSPYDFNCSYNGHLAKDGACVCGPSWKGSYCHSLDLAPARNGSGLDQLHSAPFTSTWGGSVLYDQATKLYHMVCTNQLAQHSPYSCISRTTIRGS